MRTTSTWHHLLVSRLTFVMTNLLLDQATTTGLCSYAALIVPFVRKWLGPCGSSTPPDHRSGIDSGRRATVRSTPHRQQKSTHPRCTDGYLAVVLSRRQHLISDDVACQRWETQPPTLGRQILENVWVGLSSCEALHTEAEEWV
jgi:hypothetical protein